MPTQHVFDPDGDIILEIGGIASSANPESVKSSDAGGESLTQATILLISASDTDDAGGSNAIVSARVSSKHMTLASPVFKSMLEARFAEGQQLRIEGALKLALPDDDPKALLLLLNILYHRWANISKKLSLQMLVEVATLVDKYNLSYLPPMLVEVWFQSQPESMPLKLDQNLLDLIFVSFVFRQSGLFRQATHVAIATYDGSDIECALAIPGGILGSSRQITPQSF